MSSISMKELLEAGVHFGHQTRRWNPKMKRYIYGARNGIYIIDLHQTLKLFDDAQQFVKDTIEAGGTILFVGTKKQGQDAVLEAATRCRQYYVNHRWLGGMLTNWATMRSRIAHLEELNQMEANGTLAKLPKKEATMIQEQRAKLERYLGGIKDMPRIPDVIFIVDLKKERIALAEARNLEIPVVAIVDTNCDPDEVDYVIPGNDDAIRAIKLISNKIADAVIEVKQPLWDAEAAAAGEGEEKPEPTDTGLETPDTVIPAAVEDEYARMARLASEQAASEKTASSEEITVPTTAEESIEVAKESVTETSKEIASEPAVETVHEVVEESAPETVTEAAPENATETTEKSTEVIGG